MNTVIEHATILPMTGEDSLFTGDICISGSEISYIGPKAPASCYPAEVIDGTGYAVLPSFINAHTHASMVLMRNYKDDERNLQDWLKQVWAIEDKLNEKDIRISSDLAMAEMIRSGITAFADMYFMQWETAQSAIDAGIRADIGLTLFGDEAETRHRIKDMLPGLMKFTENDLVNVSIAPHAIYTVTGESYRYGADAAKDLGLKLHTHISETRLEVDNCIAENGKTPVSYLESLGFFKAKSILAHGVHVTDDEMQILRQHDTTIVHCPSSNSKLGSGVARVRDLREAGVKLAFGTDGASSNNSLNMVKEINLGCMLAAATTLDTSALKPYEALKMATIGGAQALGLDNLVGTLEQGKKADLIMVDMGSISNTPTNNVYSALVYSSTSEDIRNVFCNGEMLMKDRRLLTINERWTKERTRRTWADLRSRK
ncbi:MAG: amidohydrolase [Spirochaetales bacterium]|nr:amidohydrolase [Spirochaetales bacterium]